MTAIIIIISIIVSLILYSIIKNKIEDNRCNKDMILINEAHKKLGYPKIDRETQIKMIINGDTSPIQNLTPDIKYKYRPTSLLNKYITVSKSDLKEYLHSNFELLEKYKIENAPNSRHDGIWISGNKIIDQERGTIHRTWNNQSKKDISDVYGNLMWEWINLE